MLNQDPSNSSAEVKTEEIKKACGLDGYDDPEEVDYDIQSSWAG